MSDYSNAAADGYSLPIDDNAVLRFGARIGTCSIPRRFEEDPLIPLKGTDKVVAVTRLSNNKVIVVTGNGRMFKVDPWDGECNEIKHR